MLRSWGLMILALLSACQDEPQQDVGDVSVLPHDAGPDLQLDMQRISDAGLRDGGLIDAGADCAAPTSTYLRMRDGVRLAVEILLPPDCADDARFPTVVRGTRYWRDYDFLRPLPELDALGPEAHRAHARGYALVVFDVRGTGASFGSRSGPWGPEERADYDEVVSWVAAQPWANGEVFSYGVSYDGNVADFIGIAQNPAIVAVAPQFSDVDPFLDLAFPGGVQNVRFTTAWIAANLGLDANDICRAADLDEADCHIAQMFIGGVKPVGGDRGLVAEAVRAHEDNVALETALAQVDFKDDPLFPGGPSFVDLSPIERGEMPALRRTPMIAFASWLDAGTARGALERASIHFPQTLYIGAWDHGGENNVDPLGQPIEPLNLEDQYARIFDYFDAARTGAEQARVIHYYVMGEGRWRTTHHWPLRGAEGFDLKRLYLLGDQRLVDDPRVAPPGQDEYTVDFSHSTGRNNRWLQGIFAEDVGVHYEDRADAPVLSYLSEPLESPLTVVGFPEVRLFLASTHTDGALHVYLEDVAPSGRVTYITEGVLRLSHRLADWGSRAPGFRNQSHAREYARPMEPGVREEIHLKLEPTAVQFAAGHRIRISIAGADAASFERLPAEGDPVLTVFWGGAGASYIELPVLE